MLKQNVDTFGSEKRETISNYVSDNRHKLELSWANQLGSRVTLVFLLFYHSRVCGKELGGEELGLLSH